MGRGYVIDHCIAARDQENREHFYRMYVTECLRFTSRNTAIAAQCITDGKAEAAYMSVSYQELLENSEKPQDNRTSEEIISDFMRDFGANENQAEDSA